MRLRSKLFLTIGLLISFILAFVAFSLLATEQRLLVKEIDMRREAALKNTADIVREANITSDMLLLVNHIKLVKQGYPEVKWLCIVDPAGTIQAGLDLNQFGLERDRVSPPADVSLSSRTVFSNGRNLGYVEIGFDKYFAESHIKTSLSKSGARIMMIGLYALALGFVGSLLLALNLSLPIRALSRVATEIGKGRLDTPVPAVERKDELGDLSRAFKEMAGHLKELDRLKQDFVTGTTHELKSPLGIIESHANAVLQDLKTAAGVPENYRSEWISSLDHIRSNSLRLDQFISDLLDVAKIERGKLKLNFQKVSIAEIIHEVLLSFVPKTRKKKIALFKQVANDLPPLSADPERLRQVLNNLIGNALKFTPEGGKITIGAWVRQRGWLYVKVADTGPGISAEFMGRIFSKFEQAKGPSGGEGKRGTGLGLAICKGIVEGHGGKIGVKPLAGRGSEFYFVLPIRET